MDGIVSCVKHSQAQGDRYTIAWCGGGFESAICEDKISLIAGDVVGISADGIDLSEHREKYREEIYAALDKTIARESMNRLYVKGIEGLDKVTAKLWDKLHCASLLFMRKLLLGIPIIIRFHNDADGSSGACCVYMGIKDLAKRVKFSSNIVWVMNKGVSYSVAEAQSDILTANNYTSIEKPLLMIIDFGTAIESNSGIAALGEKFDVIWLDHHPVVRGFEGTRIEHYINPWSYAGDSNYTAGLLASAFSKNFGVVVYLRKSIIALPGICCAKPCAVAYVPCRYCF